MSDKNEMSKYAKKFSYEDDVENILGHLTRTDDYTLENLRKEFENEEVELGN